MSLQPTVRSLTSGLPLPSEEARQLVAIELSRPERGMALCGFSGDVTRAIEREVRQVFDEPEALANVEGLVTEALEAWATGEVPVRYVPDGEQTPTEVIFGFCVAMAPSAEQQLTARGIPQQVIDTTLGSTAKQVELHQRLHRTLGVESAWWQVYGLMGGWIGIGQLHAHRIVLGRHPLGPDPWISREEQIVHGPGWRTGDEAIGLHIPHGADLSSAALDETFTKMTSLVPLMWPSTTACLLSIQTWMLDRQLASELDPTSKILSFQAAFEPTHAFAENDSLTRRLVFGTTPNPEHPTSLQAALLHLWSEGGHSRWEVGVRSLSG